MSYIVCHNEERHVVHMIPRFRKSKMLARKPAFKNVHKKPLQLEKKKKSVKILLMYKAHWWQLLEWHF